MEAPTCPECGYSVTLCNCVEEVEEEIETVSCPDCGSEDTYPDEGDEDIVWCNNCGLNIDPNSGESREASWEIEINYTLGEMTRSEAAAYVEEMLDHIEKACGYRLYVRSIE